MLAWQALFFGKSNMMKRTINVPIDWICSRFSRETEITMNLSSFRCSFKWCNQYAIAMFLLASRFAAAQPAYQIVELPPPHPTGDSHAWGINESGTVVGLALMLDGRHRATRWDEATPVDLGALPGYVASYAYDITNDGRIFGASGANCQPNLPTFWGSSQPQPLPAVDPPHLWIHKANASGVAVGEALYSCDRPWSDSAYQWKYVPGDDNWLVTVLPPLPGDSEAAANGINESGVVIGFSGDSAAPYLHACQWIGGVPSLLPDLGGNHSIGMAINAAGHFAGYSRTAGGAYRAYYFDGATAVNLGTLPGYAYSTATQLNDSGTVIGFAFNGSTEDLIYPFWYPNPNHRAFIWKSGVMYDVNTLIPPGSGWTSLESLQRINNRGQITGIGRRGGRVRGFRLTPILPGDMNCDLSVDLYDMPHFVEALLSSGFTGCDANRADLNADGLIDGRDVPGFVNLIGN